jgi:uracil-DNA glycosylase family 4
MDYHSKPSKDDLKSFLRTFRDCEDCSLHKNRKTLILGRGSVKASIIILLDKVSPRAASSGNILDGGEGKTLQQVLRFVAEDYPVIRSNLLWITPVVICPTKKIGKTQLEFLPSPSSKQATACSGRLFGEIHTIQPSIIIACGTAAYKAVTPASATPHGTNLGRVVEAYIEGDMGVYPVPMMVTNSMNKLYRDPSQNVRGIWNKTIGHFKQAVDISETLMKKRR